MTNPTHSTLDAMLPGFQLVLFEIIWPAFPWIKSIWIRENNRQLQLFVETTTEQDEKEWDDLDYLIRERFDVKEKMLNELEPDSKHKIEHTIQHGPAVPKNCGYRELISDRLFKKIAKKYAPRRLKLGR
jgi:hypothetical protein